MKPVTQVERRLLDRSEVDCRFFAIVTDLVGTPRELVDEQGKVAWRTRATLWGTTTWNRSATAYTPLRFPGQYRPRVGLHYNRHRHTTPVGPLSSRTPWAWSRPRTRSRTSTTRRGRSTRWGWRVARTATASTGTACWGVDMEPTRYLVSARYPRKPHPGRSSDAKRRPAAPFNNRAPPTGRRKPIPLGREPSPHPPAGTRPPAPAAARSPAVTPPPGPPSESVFAPGGGGSRVAVGHRAATRPQGAPLTHHRKERLSERGRSHPSPTHPAHP